MVEIDYGDTVEIKVDAPSPFQPRLRVSTCGFRIVENQVEAQAVGFAIGTRLWLVEKGDGSSFEIPEEFIEKVDEN
ncbi:MAG: hypothetical protein HQM09_23500 [Candidatus Riflebacteria bacterium]|nr:hypothetical protein [Candidatus Riflebacteria bacterium]